MKKPPRKLILLLFRLFLIGVMTINISAQTEPDYPDFFGLCLGMYKIGSEIIPKEFANFEYFYFEKFPNQDTDKPKKDSENRVFIRGEIKLTDNTILKIKKAFVRSITINGDKDYYKDIYFETVSFNGLSYKFSGEFLEKRDNENGLHLDVKGILTKYKSGQKVAESELKFYEYAEL